MESASVVGVIVALMPADAGAGDTFFGWKLRAVVALAVALVVDGAALVFVASVALDDASV